MPLQTLIASKVRSSNFSDLHWSVSQDILQDNSPEFDMAVDNQAMSEIVVGIDLPKCANYMHL